MDFNDAVEHVLDSEGGYVNDPQDPGGETKYGISKRQYPSLDIMMLSKDKARQIYEQDYWNKCNCSRLPEKIRLCVFDGAVNHGTPTMAKMLQRLLGVTADGVVGPVTQRAAMMEDENKLLDDLLTERALYYSRLRTFGRFGRGWMKRLFSVARVSY